MIYTVIASEAKQSPPCDAEIASSAALPRSDTLPAGICFYTEGVKLVTPGSPILESLRALEAKGVHLVICSTCLNHYNLQDQVEVGVVGGMTDILEAQWRADKVITL